MGCHYASVISLVNPDPRNPIVDLLNRLTQPAFIFVRRKMPFVVISGIDLSPIVIIFGLQFIDTLLKYSIYPYLEYAKRGLS